MSASHAEFFVPDPDATIERQIDLHHSIEPVVSPYSEAGALLSTTELIEANLPFAQSVAKALQDAPIAEHRRVGTPITPYTELEDRIQDASEGLVLAVQEYTLDLTAHRNPTPEGFAIFLARYIDERMTSNTSSEYIRETLGPRLPEHLLSVISRLQASEETDDLLEIATRHEKSAGVIALHGWLMADGHLSLDTLVFPWAATEETKDNEQDEPSLGSAAEVIPQEIWSSKDDEPPILSAAEVIADTSDVAEDVTNRLLIKELQKVIDQLRDQDALFARLRFGLNPQGKRYSRAEIAAILGVAKDSLRALESKIMNNIQGRIMSPDDQVTSWQASSMKSDLFTGRRIKTGKTPVVYHQVTTQSAETVPTSEEDTSYEALVYIDPTTRPKEGSEEYTKVRDIFIQRMTHMGHYVKRPLDAPKLPYPAALCNELDDVLGQSLTPRHIEDFWNNVLPDFLNRMHDEHGSDLDMDLIGQAVSRLLSTRMQERDSVTLRLNRVRQYNYLGAWARKGEIVLKGCPGDFTGLHMSGTAVIRVLGDVGRFAGKHARGRATMIVEGKAGNYLGQGASENAMVSVAGMAQSYAGQKLRGNAIVRDRGTVWYAK